MPKNFGRPTPATLYELMSGDNNGRFLGHTSYRLFLLMCSKPKSSEVENQKRVIAGITPARRYQGASAAALRCSAMIFEPIRGIGISDSSFTNLNALLIVGQENHTRSVIIKIIP